MADRISDLHVFGRASDPCLCGQLISHPRHRQIHQPLLSSIRRHGSRLGGHLRLHALPLPVQERPHRPPRRRPHRPRRDGSPHRGRLQGRQRRGRQRAHLPPARRHRQGPGHRLLPRRRLCRRLARAALHPRLPQRPRRPIRRHRRVGVLPRRAGAQAPRRVRRRVGRRAVGGDPRRRRRAVAARPRRPVPRVRRRVQRRRQHRAQHGRPRLGRRRAPRRRDPPRARARAPVLHRDGGRRRRDLVRPRDPGLHGSHVAVRGLRDLRAGRPAGEPVRGRRGARGLGRHPVPARAGVRGRERRPAQGARSVVPPGAQGQRLHRRDGVVQTEGRRPRVPLQRAGIGACRRAAGADRGFRQEMTKGMGQGNYAPRRWVVMVPRNKIVT